MNRHRWREVRRQLVESRGAGAVTVLLLAITSAWSGTLWEAHRWLGRTLLNPFTDASVAATVDSQEALAPLLAALAEEFPTVEAGAVPSAMVRDQLLEWFPDVSSAMSGIPVDTFPALVTLTAGRDLEDRVVSWLRSQPRVALVEHSSRWEARVRDSFRTVWMVAAVVGGALLAACTVVVVLAVRLLVQLHREEIAIMRLIGAYERDIRLPYVLSGLVLGLVGGLVGAGTLALLWLGVRSLTAAAAFPWDTLVVLPPASGMVGLIGAILGLAAVRDSELKP